MNFIEHPSNNAVLGAPPAWNHEAIAVHALPVTRTHLEGQPVVISYWQPSAEEIECIVAGKPVALVVFGQSMPPVAVAVTAV